MRDGLPRAVSRIGDVLLDLELLMESGDLPTNSGFSGGAINPDPAELSRLRQALFELLRAENGQLRDDTAKRERALFSAARSRMGLPLRSRGYVDFYSGIHHASNVGKMFRPEMPPLLPNYRSLPVAYNGRASSLYPTGTPIQRPYGQLKRANVDAVFAPSEELDFELEMGFYVGRGNGTGDPITPDNAFDHIAGFVLVNDWSARDVQRWEYQPLGPFLAKSFATSVSPWLVTVDALEPFRCEGMIQDPAPLAYLKTNEFGHFAIDLEVRLRAEGMTDSSVISRTNSLNLYWSAGQQLAHQTSNRTPVEPGDLYASGTISSETAFSDSIGGFGSLLELTYRGAKPISVGPNVERAFLQDGDELTLTGWAQGEGFRVGFGEVTGQISPAGDFPS